MLTKIVSIILSLTVMFGVSGCGNQFADLDRVTSVPFNYEKAPASSEAEPLQYTGKNLVNDVVSGLVVNNIDKDYTYDDLVCDIEKIKELPSISILKVCDTYDKRIVYDIAVGDLDNSKHVLIMGAMHAREYITSQLVMKQLCDYIMRYNNDSYNGVNISELGKDCTVHFIPMVNPDGVAISMFGKAGLQTVQAQNLYEEICRENNFSDYTQWKANAEGVDINRNFDADWEQYNSYSNKPAPDHYKGIYPGCTKEAAGLIRITGLYNIKRTISYHTKGSVIYWYYKQTGSILDRSKEFSNEISSATGYALDDNYEALDAAGYKDWAVYKLGIPSITIEVGGEANGSPVNYRDFSPIWEKNKNVVPAMLYNLKNE